jgi:hypothetical protein
LFETEDKLEQVTKKLKNAVKREKRAKATCQKQVQDLYDNNLINIELKAKLDSFGGSVYKNMLIFSTLA